MMRLGKALSEEGAQIAIVGRKLPDSLPLTKAPYPQYRLHCLFRKGPFFYLEFQLRLIAFLLFKKVDLLGAIDYDTLPAIWVLSKLKRRPFLLDCHEIFEEVPELAQKPLVRKIWRFVGQTFGPSATFFWTVNQSLADRIGMKLNRKFSVIKNLPEITTMPSAAHKVPDKKIILYQGRLNKGRGLEAAIEAMADLPQFKLVLAGGGDLEETLKNQVKLSGLKNIEITGNLRPEELQQHTTKAWIGLNLLDPSSGNYYFSLANKFFDYMAFGVPSLSMNFPEYRRINEEYGFSILLESNEAKELAEAILKLHNHPDQWLKLQHNACRAANKLNWEIEKKKVKEILSVGLE